jgi:hypothetical protein
MLGDAEGLACKVSARAMELKSVLLIDEKESGTGPLLSDSGADYAQNEAS